MTYPFIEDYRRRRTHVRRYMAVVCRVERQTRLGSGRQLETDRLHILRAGTFLILYNLVEASARAAVEGIHDAMATGRIAFGSLNGGIRREVIKGFKRNANPDIHAEMANIAVELVTASLDIEYHFSGNVDARLIRDVAETYGFSTNTNTRRTHSGQDLLTVKTNRNDLAHGSKTYDEVGRDFTARDLLEIGFRTMAYMEEVLGNVAAYIDGNEYLQR